MDFELRIIVSYAEGRVMGNKGKIPWSIEADRKRFKDSTKGKAVIVGRRTSQFLEPLSGRERIVLTHDITLDTNGEGVVYDFEEAVRTARFINPEVAYIGGGHSLYMLALAHNLTKRIEATEIHRSYQGDTFFPELGSEWKEITRRERSYTRTNGEVVTYSFVDYER